MSLGGAWVAEEAESKRVYLDLVDAVERKKALFRGPDLQVALKWRERTKPTEGWARRYGPGFKEAMDLYFGRRETAMGDQLLLLGAQGFMFNGWNVKWTNNLTDDGSAIHGIATMIGDGIALGVQIEPEDIEEVGRAEGDLATLVRARVAAGSIVYEADRVIDVEFDSTVVATS